MKRFVSGILIFLSLASFANATEYELNNFYYHDRGGNTQFLPLAGKLLLKNEDAVKDYIKQQNLLLDEERNTRNGLIVNFQNTKDLFDTMKELHGKPMEFTPIVKWEGMQCIPDVKTLLIRPHQFATKKLLTKRLEDYKVFKNLNIVEFDDHVYVMSFDELASPYNIFMAANMVAEDTAWFSWARPQFIPVYFPILANLKVSPGNGDLGYKRTLELTIIVHDPNIKVRKDTLPVFGVNGFIPGGGMHKGIKLPSTFRPTIHLDDVWYDYDPPKISESITPDRRIITVKYGFRYLRYGRIGIPAAEVAYELNGEQKTIYSHSTSYENNSVIADTEITDMQCIDWDIDLLRVAEPAVLPEPFNWGMIGWIVLVMGGFIAFFIVLYEILFRLESSRKDVASNYRLKIYDNLKAVSQKEYSSANWKESYVDIIPKLYSVLDEFFNIKTPVSHDDPRISIDCIAHAIKELDKLYQPNPEKCDFVLLHSSLKQICDLVKIQING